MTDMLTSLVAILASLAGLWASLRIFNEKKKKKKLVCPLRANCDKVVHSTHSATFGIPNEMLGMLYYCLIGMAHAALLSLPHLVDGAPVRYAMLLASLVGVVLSIYFLALQAIVIRAWCSLCLVSAAASVVLGLSLFSLVNADTVAAIGEHRTLWIIVHSIGFILGVGAASITDIFFFRFLKDHQVSEEEKGTLEALTGVIWAGLAVLVISGLMLFLPEQARLADSPKFLLKTVVVGAIVMNGLALNLFVSPRMRQLSFEGTKPARRFRRLAFALGGISIVSWYAAFVLGSLRHLGSYSFAEGLVGYGALLLVVGIASQLFERLAVRGYHAISANPESLD